MTEVNGKYFLTLVPVENEVFHITNTALRKVDILNLTDAFILVSNNADFATDGVTADYICIPPEMAVNGINIASVGLYIKSQTGDGDIVIMGAE